MASILNHIKEDHNMWDDMVRQIRADHLGVLVYGNGNSARMIVEKLDPDMRIEGIVVSHPYFKENTTFCGHPILDADTLQFDMKRDAALIFSICPSAGMVAWANSITQIRQVISYDGQQLLFAPMTIGLLRENERVLTELHDNMADTRSQETMRAYLNCRISGNLDYLAGISEPDLYFNPTLLHFSEHETFVDCGAYTGDTVVRFHAFTKGQYERIYAFEPNMQYHDVMERETGHVQNLHIIKKGLWDRRDILRFESERGSMSGIDENGMTSVEVDRMDAMLTDAPVSFIKMNIEGAEYNALSGASSIIRRYAPKLAISVYHRPDDLIRIPSLIRGCNPGYRFSLRTHSPGSGLTVLYAQA